MSERTGLITPDRDLVRRLDVAAPRYTSYPTINVWKETKTDDGFVQALESTDADKPMSLYLHVPFCHSICHYCGCNTRKLKHEDQVVIYVRHLLDEIRMARSFIDGKRRVVQIHWGGGTPTVLNKEQFSSVFDLLHECFELDPDAEIAIETNPMTCDDEKLAYLGTLGFNRFSIGIQDFDPVVQGAIGRHQTFERTADFAMHIREFSVDSLNVDLVYGLPSQTKDGLAKTLQKVVELRPDRIAVYSFAFLPTMRDNQQNINARTVPQGDEKFDLYLQTISSLQSAGYASIGMDHFALPDDELAQAHREHRLRRNFMGYTTKPETDMLAFGATAISDFGSYYAQTHRGLVEYYENIESGTMPVMREMHLDEDDLIRRRVIMSMLCNNRVEKTAIDREFGIDFDETFAPEIKRLNALIREGLITNDTERIEATPLGSYFLRNIALVFDNYLDGRKGPVKENTFSRTV